MTRYARIENGIVVNVAVADESFALANGLIACGNAGPGWLYANGIFSAPLPDLESMAAEIRATRNAMLTACDWTQVADAPVNSLAWANYRQALRDLPEQPGFPWDVIWPSEPT